VIRKRFSEKEHHPYSAHELFAIVQEEWEEIDQGTIDDLIDLMPCRIQAVIEADGGHTKWCQSLGLFYIVCKSQALVV
jgi:hypothetical protein